MLTETHSLQVENHGVYRTLVDEGVDSGPILAQREVPILPDDDEESLQDRVRRSSILYIPRLSIFSAMGRFH